MVYQKITWDRNYLKMILKFPSTPIPLQAETITLENGGAARTALARTAAWRNSQFYRGWYLIRFIFHHFFPPNPLLLVIDLKHSPPWSLQLLWANYVNPPTSKCPSNTTQMASLCLPWIRGWRCIGSPRLRKEEEGASGVFLGTTKTLQTKNSQSRFGSFPQPMETWGVSWKFQTIQVQTHHCQRSQCCCKLLLNCPLQLFVRPWFWWTSPIGVKEIEDFWTPPKKANLPLRSEHAIKAEALWSKVQSWYLCQASQNRKHNPIDWRKKNGTCTTGSTSRCCWQALETPCFQALKRTNSFEVTKKKTMIFNVFLYHFTIMFHPISHSSPHVKVRPKFSGKKSFPRAFRPCKVNIGRPSHETPLGGLGPMEILVNDEISMSNAEG